eukprot:scaffold446_cov183-Ochromonas_danica.AAC.7
MQESPKFTVNITDFHRAAVPPELQRIAGGPNGTVMLVPRQVTHTLLQDLLTAQSAPPPVYLTGPGGVGKSSILFMTAAAVLRHNAQLRRSGDDSDQQRADPPSPIFLLYIANAGLLTTLPIEEAAVELCKMVRSLNPREGEFIKVLEVLDRKDLSNLQRWNQICLLLREADIPNLILVDQWNAVIEESASLDKDHPLHRFRTIDTKIGFSKFVGAVRSSFTPINVGKGVFRDGEAESAKCRIGPLNMEDLKALRDIWAVRQPPVEVDDGALLTLHEFTGGIPRLCEYFAAQRSSNPSATIEELFCWTREKYLAETDRSRH